MTILFIHSAGEQGGDHGSSHLADYIKDSLGSGFKMKFPEMPDPENPIYKKWKEAISEVMETLDGPLILIGHSLGGSILLKYLSDEKCDKPIKALFLIAVPFWGKKDWEIEEFLLEPGFEEKIKTIPDIFLYHSQDDKWVPFSHLIQYAKKLPEAGTRKIEGAEHEFFYGLPELIADIKSITDNG